MAFNSHNGNLFNFREAKFLFKSGELGHYKQTPFCDSAKAYFEFLVETKSNKETRHPCRDVVHQKQPHKWWRERENEPDNDHGVNNAKLRRK